MEAKFMKKIFTLILSAMILTFTASCGVSDISFETGTETVAVSTAPEADTTADPAPQVPTETVLYSAEDLIITAHGIEQNKFGENLQLSIQNLGDQEIQLGFGYEGNEYTSVNGYALEYTDYVTVGAGETEETTIAFSDDVLSLYGIANIEEMEIGFTVIEDGNEQYLAPVTYTVIDGTSENFYLEGYQLAVTDPTVQAANGITAEAVQLLVPFENNGINILSETITMGENGHRTLNLELENTTDRLAYIGFDEWEINGINFSEYAGELAICPAGKRIVLSYDIDTMLGAVPLSAIGIDKLDNIDMDFTVGTDNDHDGIIDAEGSETIDVRINLSGIEGLYNSEFSEDEVIYSGLMIDVIAKGVIDIEGNAEYNLGAAYLIKNKTPQTLVINPTEISVKLNGVLTQCSTDGCSIEGGEIGALIVLFSEAPVSADELTSIELVYTKTDLEGNVLDSITWSADAANLIG